MSYRALVSQHLSSARLVLAQLSAHDNISQALQRALEHSALHLLHSAYLCQLRAIADNYHCTEIATINDVEALQRALAGADMPAPEAAEIEVLVLEGWLGAFLKAHRQLCLPTSTQAPAVVMPTTSRSDITLRDEGLEELEGPEDRPLSVKTLQGYWQRLDELVQRQSEMMLEY